jgi:acetyl-CoA synthase
MVGGGLQTPGFIGHSKHYIGSNKYIKAEGGARRIVWMNSDLKEELEPILRDIGENEGIKDFNAMIADESVAETEEEVLAYITRMNHPAISMVSLF